MFAKAYSIANKYTHPLIVAIRFYDGTIEGGLGSFVILNDEGWCMTAAHNFGTFFTYNEHQPKIKEHLEKLEKIKLDSQINELQKQKRIDQLNHDKKWITDFSILLGGRQIEIGQSHIHGENDIAFFKIDPKAIQQTIFPKIKHSENISPGTSLCKLGFPFVDVRPTFDINTRQFHLPDNLLPVPLFPIEGIYTRNLFHGKTADGSTDILFLETSSPGLRGQSGGPIFDTDGNIYAIQSHNLTIPLGFKGTVETNGAIIEENQFFNVGAGVHPSVIETLLNRHNIRYVVAE